MPERAAQDFVRFASAAGDVDAPGGVVTSPGLYAQGDPVRYVDATGKIVVGSLVTNVDGLYAQGDLVRYVNAAGAVHVKSMTGTAPLFAADWGTALGTGTTALRDGTKFSGVNNATAKLTVVEVSTLAGLSDPVVGFPAGLANVLRIEQASSGACDVTKTSIGTTPAVGDSLYHRCYLAVAVANAQGNFTNITGNHWWQPAVGNDAYTWNWNFGSKSDGTFPIAINFLETPYPSRWHPGNPEVFLNKFQAYRLEWKVTKTSDSGGNGATTGTPCGAYTAEARIYDMGGTLVYESGTLYNQSAISLAANPAQRCVDSAMRKLFFGIVGASTWTGLAAGQYAYVGAVCVRNDNWCGPYVPGIG